MGEIVSAKVFKSGNSVALRLPKSLGLQAGDEMNIVLGDRQRFTVEAKDAPKKKFNIAKVAGSAKNLKYIRPEDRIFEERPSVLAKRAKGAGERSE